MRTSGIDLALTAPHKAVVADGGSALSVAGVVPPCVSATSRIRPATGSISRR